MFIRLKLKLKLKFAVLLFFCLLNNSYSQKNSLSITPIKPLLFESVELSYERELKNKVVINSDIQVWFFDRKPYTFINDSPEPRSYKRDICKGSRYSLGVQRYVDRKKQKQNKWYVGGSVFYGHHKVEKYIQDFYGNLKTGNYGWKISIGSRWISKDNVTVDLGLDFGRSWLTKHGQSLILRSPNGGRRIYPIESPVFGVFFNPKLSIGYVF